MHHHVRAPVVVIALLLTGPAAAAEAPPPAASPAPSPEPRSYVRFIEADVLPGERVANAYTPDLTGSITNRLRGTLEYRIFGGKLGAGPSFFEIEYRRWKVAHPAGDVTAPATFARTFVPAQTFTDQDVFVNTSLIGAGHTYLATSTWIHSTSDGDPTLHSSIGFGAERLPDPSKAASLFFTYYYYPEVSGTIAARGTVPAAKLRYTAENYSVGGTLRIPRTPAFLSAGFLGDRSFGKENAASGASHASAQLGVGVRL